MKNLNKLIRILQSYYCLGLCVCILQAEVVITEFFINPAEGTTIPQYIELYNTSSGPINLEGWSIITKYQDGAESSYLTEFSLDNKWATIHNSSLEIEANGYFLISSNWIGGVIFSNNHNSDIEVLFILSEAGSIYLYEPGNSDPKDQVEYDISDTKTGHSTILHLSDDTWSLSPEKEKSSFLYEGSQVLNYGSPREENAFKLIAPENYVHIISGDISDFSGDLLEFSWKGTFYEVTDQSYRLIIKKLDSWKPTMHGFGSDTFEESDTLIWEGISDTIYPVRSDDLLIDQLEVANYTWTVELTKTNSGIIDTIYSDEYTFTINASDYGVYGCVDHNSCTVSSSEYPTCPTNAENDTLFSNHPAGCTPGVDCYSALNYHETANINSNICHYVSLSVPAFVTGDSSAVVTVPVYLYNDYSANINSIAYTLSFGNSSEIILYNEDESTFAGTILSGLGNENIIYDGSESISVNMADISINGAGIITYLVFELIGSPSEVMGLTFSSPIIIGGEPENNIQVPVKDGKIVILQPNYEIWGNVVYYSGDDPYEIPNVELNLSQQYNGGNVPEMLVDFTNASGYYNFNSLMEGYYSLSFSKESGIVCNEDGNYISGVDISFIARHITGSEPFNSDQEIAGDVSLDGTVSGLDASLVAQYNVDLIDNFNDFNTHWIFKPVDTTTLAEIYADLIKDNGEYMIEYSPLVFDDVERDIYAFRLGDVNGNYCHDAGQSRFNDNILQFNNIIVEYKPVISLPIILAESVYLQGMDIEIGYDKDIFEPLSITFNSLNQQSENYESLSNLFSHEGTIKTVIWAADDPQLINGIIGEVSFNWKKKNKGGKIWLENIQVNDVSARGGINLTSFNGEEIAMGVNVINKLYPGKINLQQNYPNPFNPQTTIYWSLPNLGNVSVDVYNIQGQLISHLFDGYIEPGTHEQLWNASGFPSGIYIYRLTIGKTVLQKKMILLR